ncbi:MAG: hypothetical protein ACLFRT_15345 [Actinomycetota bacterium]
MTTIPPSTNDWLRSPEDIPIYSTGLVRDRHWLEPVSTMVAPESSKLTEEELYMRAWSKQP